MELKSLSEQRRSRDYLRPKRREILDPSDPNFLKRKPSAEPETPRAPPQRGDLAPSSIFDEGQPQREPAANEPTQPSASSRDPSVLAAALDPNPVARQRWQRKMIIRDVRNRGQLTKAQRIARTERESLCKSQFIRTSIKKLYPLARQIAGKPIEEAIIQMRFSKKRAAKDVKKHLEYARDEAIVKRGMGLGMAKPEDDQAAENKALDADTNAEANQEHKLNWSGMVVEDKKGKRRFVNDTSSIYVDEAWVGRGSYARKADYRARGRVNFMRPPETSLTVRLKEEATRIRLMDEREQKRQKKKVWVALPDRPVTAQRQYCLCNHHPPFKYRTREQSMFSFAPLTMPALGLPNFSNASSKVPSSVIPAFGLSNPTADPSSNPQPPHRSPRPTIILIHGGWQGPENYALILPGLESAGYSVIPVTLPSTTTVPAITSFAPDVDAIRNAVASCLAAGKDVIMIMHSYGAVVGCEALKGISAAQQLPHNHPQLRMGRVLRLGFIAGLLFPVGKSTLDPRFTKTSTKGFECEV
ncbi:MAG: hypothetical protein Q9218_007488 [Villophora microphyllina]